MTESMGKNVLNLILWERTRWRLLLLLTSLVATFFGLLAPYFQKEFVDHLTGAPSLYEFSWLGSQSLAFFVFIAFLCLLIHQGLNQLTSFLGAREAVFSQRQLADQIYQKTLALKVDTMSQRPIGEIVSLYATDVPGSTILLEQTLPQGATTFFPLILAPIALSFLLHTSLVPTVLVMVLVSALNTALAFRQSKFFFLFKQLAAERIGLVNEWINNMRGLRILGWMDSFENKILRKRVLETKNRIRMVTNGQIMNSISSSLTFALNTIALTTLTLGNEQIPTSGEIFASLWILGIFLTRPFRQMPWFFTFAFDGWTSIKRVQNFLNTKNNDSIPSPQKSRQLEIQNKNSFAIRIHGLHLQKKDERPLLNHIDFELASGEFVALVGPVGCGKSLLLLSLLRETGATFTNYEIDGSSVLNCSKDEIKSAYSYVPQESFIMRATLEQNIEFDYSPAVEDPSAILSALSDSQFLTQGERLPLGLETELGERGINLSGGQKQRISMARAAFHQRPIILVDDGFSNLDIKTEQALLETLFFGRWKNNSRILATHRLSVLPTTDRVIFMKEGRIVNQGSYEDLLKTDPEFRNFTASLAKTEAAAYEK